MARFGPPVREILGADQGQTAREASLRPTTGPVGDTCDGATAEAFFATRKREPLGRRSFRTRAGAWMAVFHPIGGFCDPSRRHPPSATSPRHVRRDAAALRAGLGEGSGVRDPHAAEPGPGELLAEPSGQEAGRQSLGRPGSFTTPGAGTDPGLGTSSRYSSLRVRSSSRRSSGLGRTPSSRIRSRERSRVGC